jgi:hypothetical protein
MNGKAISTFAVNGNETKAAAFDGNGFVGLAHAGRLFGTAPVGGRVLLRKDLS